MIHRGARYGLGIGEIFCLRLSDVLSAVNNVVVCAGFVLLIVSSMELLFEMFGNPEFN